ncbi:NAD(P)H-binding protein [Streptomyces sp. TRM70308]|uniref:NAD(P)H-binding protein n=1 Tax=Streptomyces sp. TRM70308 TaxID=3131932 RepID=UPI003D086C64
MILVTGATGTVGGEVLHSLPPGTPVRLLTRYPDRLAALPPGAEAVAADYADPASLARALRGVTRAFLVTTRVGGAEDAAFLAAAREAGVGHVVKLSAAAVADPAADDLVTRWQRRTEALLTGSGLRWTLLRPRAFMSNCLSWAPSVRAERVVRALYGTSRNACVDPRDVAGVAVRALTEDGHHGAAHTLTGPEAVSATEQTARLADVLGVPLRFEELTPAQTRVALTRRHGPRLADALLAAAVRQRDGAKVAVTQTVREVTGAPARSFATWAADHASAFTAPAEGGGAGGRAAEGVAAAGGAAGAGAPGARGATGTAGPGGTAR